jgi:hypothetical protein
VLTTEGLTTDQKGAIAEAKIAAEAVALGVGVSKPLSPLRYDLIFDIDARLLRVQCKWANSNGEVVVVRCRTSRRGPNGYVRSDYTCDEVDLIAAYCGELDRCYVLRLDRFPARCAIQLRLRHTRNNQRRLINWADDFVFDARLKALLGP